MHILMIFNIFIYYKINFNDYFNRMKLYKISQNHSIYSLIGNAGALDKRIVFITFGAVSAFICRNAGGWQLDTN